ncbi:MAG: hypothetical protein ABIR83_09715 [Nakamurella sp.]
MSSSARPAIHPATPTRGWMSSSTSAVSSRSFASAKVCRIAEYSSDRSPCVNRNMSAGTRGTAEAVAVGEVGTNLVGENVTVAGDLGPGLVAGVEPTAAVPLLALDYVGDGEPAAAAAHRCVDQVVRVAIGWPTSTM